MKKTTKHTFYEIWNEYNGQVVYIDHKPTKEELLEICNKEKYFNDDLFDDINLFIKKHIYVYKLQPLYTNKI